MLLLSLCESLWTNLSNQSFSIISRLQNYLMRILINTISTKKHSGGAYQIAFNFILKSQEHSEVEWIYVVSKDLDEIMPELLKREAHYYVFPTQPDFKHSYKRVKKELSELELRLKPDVVYSITAPSYFTFETTEVMRFTMPWVTHPNKYSWSVLSWKAKMKMQLYCWNQRRMMKKAKYFITQSETTRQGILRITGTKPENVKVVPNVLPAIYKTLLSSPLPQDEEWIDIACVANTSAHKNLDILPQVIKELQTCGVDNLRFHVTIPTSGVFWKNMQRQLDTLGIGNRVITHGRCSQIELAEMYRSCQLCFLPTLLEVFSATTLEAMYFHLPTVATDFEFNREVMGDACMYYEPKNARQAAEFIKQYIDSKELREEMKVKMEERLKQFSDYDKHFNEILGFLIEVVDR